MLTNLNAHDSSSRLVEALAGSTSLLSDSNGIATGSGLPLSLASLTGDTTANDDQHANASSDLALAPLEPVTALLHDPLGGTGGSNLLGLGEIFVDNDGAAPNASALDLANANEPLQPVFDATNVLVKDIHFQLETLSHQTGTSDIVHAITGLGEAVGLGNTGVLPPAADGHTNLLTDVVNLPGTLLDGGVGDAVSQIGGDLGDTIHATTGLVNAVLNGNDPVNPVPELINSLGSDLQNIPLLTVNGGNNAGNGGLLGGIAGDLNGSSSGHLIDVDAGPHDPNGLGLDILAAPGTGGHTAEINAVDVGPNGPQLVDLGVLTGDTINIPSLNGAGTDGLVGNVLGSTLGGDIASGNHTSLPIDIAAVNDVLSGPIGGDHGVLDLHSAHIL